MLLKYEQRDKTHYIKKKCSLLTVTRPTLKHVKTREFFHDKTK